VKHINKAVRAKEIQKVTNNGKNRIMARKLDKLMENKETLAILNALFQSTSEV
jgi:hypothetical protein